MFPCHHDVINFLKIEVEKFGLRVVLNVQFCEEKCKLSPTCNNVHAPRYY